MEVVMCKRCGKIFQYISGPRVCQPCKKVEEDIFLEVKEYLRENRGATLEEVSDETRASVTLIKKFLREGRLEVAADSPITMNCEKCGKTIRKGRLCKKCNDGLASGLQGAASGLQAKSLPKTESKNRMHFIKN